jgi:hypothetical protein
MEKKYFFVVLVILIVPFSGTNAFGQTLIVDAYVGDLQDIDQSKYKASGVTITRNDNGELISLTKVDAARYLNDPIVDEFLNSKPEYLVKQGKLNEQNVSLYNIKIEHYNPQCVERIFDTPGFYNECDWYHRAFSTILGVTDSEGIEHTIFRGLNHNFLVKSGYDVTTFWNIFSRD